MSALEWFPPLPVPPSREEMEQAIAAFAAEWWNVDQAQGSPADLAILGLAERLAAVRAANAPTCSVAPNLGP